MVKIKVDLHNHTVYSDGMVSIEQLISNTKKLNFKVVTKSDHDTSNGNKKLKRLAINNNLIFIPCIEISTKNGHLLAINIDNWKRKDGEVTLQEQVEEILDLGGIPIIAHPYWRGSLGKNIFSIKGALGYEIMNHTTPFGTYKLIRESLKEPGLFSTFGKYSCSDSHGGTAYGHFYTEIDAADLSKDSLIEGMFKQNISAYCPELHACLILFLKDGMLNQVAQGRREIKRIFKERKEKRKSN